MFACQLLKRLLKAGIKFKTGGDLVIFNLSMSIGDKSVRPKTKEATKAALEKEKERKELKK